MIDKFNISYEKEDFDKVRESIESAIHFKGTNLWVLIFAIFIASLGLNVNSTAVIIGAMLISPLMGPIMGIGYSMAINDIELLRKSFFSYLFATTVGLLTSSLYFFLSPLNQAHSEILARTSPNIYDVLIALFGGLAGMIALSSKLKGNVIPGVAIATALMPPLCTAGYGFSSLKFEYFFGAFYLFIINTVFIALATLIVARFLKTPYKHLPKREDEIKARNIVWVVVLITLLPSIYLGIDLIKRNKSAEAINKFIEVEANFPNDYLLRKAIDLKNRKITLVYGGDLIKEEQVEALKRKLLNYQLSNFEIEIKQGFASLSEKNNQESENFYTALTEKDKIIQILQGKIDSLNVRNELSVQVFKELRTQSNAISSLSLQPSLVITDTLSTKKWVAVITSKPPLKNGDKIKIEAWLKVRINAPDIKIIFEQ
ncbi:MAG: TIGR00341 family protein [Bacteroidetes bacterium]|nr:TIGR00341 family protein [Bacteroidota bacterium]